MSSKDKTKDFTYYTKGIWIEKKQRAYQAWLSYELSPTATTNPASQSFKRLYAKVRGCVARVYHKDPVVQSAMLKVEANISTGRMKLLLNGGIMSSPHMKKSATKLLMGYDPFWLKLGLETVFRKTIPPKQKGAAAQVEIEEVEEPQLRILLANFIEQYFFSASDLQKKLKKNVKRRSAIMDEVAGAVLKRFLLMVYLLDRTITTAELPASLPLLFDPSSKVKTSADMIRQFLKGSLFGEGDTVKQLDHMGYHLSYSQGVVHEFDYRPTNLLVDFRDGIRSCRLAELLLGSPLMHRVNFNTMSNAVKVFNVKLALSKFTHKNKSVALLNDKAIHHQDIVDGHGEMTVGYLWNIALMFQIPKLVTVSALVFEILQVKVRVRSQMSLTDSKICFPTGYDMRLALLLTWVQTVVSQYGASVKNYHSSFADGSVLCYLICHYLPSCMTPETVYIASVDEIKEEASAASQSCSDDEIDLEEDDDLKEYGVYSGKGWMDKATFKKHKAGILQNFDRVFTIMRTLGGIPETISALDFEEQGPDQTAVILYVSYMCGRLLQVSREERAALLIQRTWKIYKGYADPIELVQLEARKKERRRRKTKSEYHPSRESRFTAYEFHRQQYSLSHRTQSRISISRASSSSGTMFSGYDSSYMYFEPKEVEAVVKLQAIAKGTILRRRFLKLKKAVAVLESHQPMIRDRCQYLKKQNAAKEVANAAATLIRASYLRHLYKTSFQSKRASAIVIQKHWRRFLAQKRYREMKEAMEAIKASIKAMKEKEEAERRDEAAVRIQSAWKRVYCRTRFLKTRSAAVRIQAHERGHLTRQNMKQMKSAAIVIQSTFRMYLQRRSYKNTVLAAVCLQKWVRMWMAKRHYEATKQAALTIQSIWRMHVCHSAFLKSREAAIQIQSTFRGYQTLKSFKQDKAAVVAIQAQWRSHSMRKKFLTMKDAAVFIQSSIRMAQSRRTFLEKRAACIEVQRWYRACVHRAAMKQYNAAVKIQSAWKGHRLAKQYQKERSAALIIQRAIRVYQKQRWLDIVELRLSSILTEFVSVMERTHEVVKAAIILQAYTRGYLVRKNSTISASEIKERGRQRLAVKKIQRAYRMYRSRQELLKKVLAAGVLQTWMLTIKARCRFLKIRRSVIKIQRCFRRYQVRRTAAALMIQREFRDYRIRRQIHVKNEAAIKIQSIWRGRKVRKAASKEVKKAVLRLKTAEIKAQEDPTKTLKYKCDQAVHAVKNNTNVEQTFLALASLEMGTMYSQRCCQDIVKSDALIPLLRVMAKCNRSADHQSAFARGLQILQHLCKYKGLTMKVFKATECLDTLSERLQYYRDCPAIFSSIISIFNSLLAVPYHKEELANNEYVIKQLNSLWSLLSRKIDTEKKYINKLEADKASDTSAKRATEKAFVASQQLVELSDLFVELGVEPADFAKYAHMMTSDLKSKEKKKKTKKLETTYEDWRAEATDWKPKNMIAKEKLTQLRTSGLPRESSVGAPAKSTYVPPKVQRRLRVLSTDDNAEAMERRTNIRLMSDYQRKRSKNVSMPPMEPRSGVSRIPRSPSRVSTVNDKGSK